MFHVGQRPKTERAYRYAIYFAPEEDTALARFGREWLGRDALTGEPVPQIAAPDLDPRALFEITADPRFYGFHATLKPPFVLAPGQTRDALFDAAEEFAFRHVPFFLPRLRVAALGQRVTLQIRGACDAVATLACECVRDFDWFRAPPIAGEFERWRRERLTARQESLLEKWGYPYAMEEFRFHITLTGSLPDGERERVTRVVESLTEDIRRQPVAVDSICVFEQRRPRTPFVLMERFRFQGARVRPALPIRQEAPSANPLSSETNLSRLSARAPLLSSVVTPFPYTV